MFRTLYQRYTPKLLDAARHMTPTEDDAQDVVLETWLRIFARRHTYTGGGSLQGWMFAICRAVSLDHYRSAKRRTKKMGLLEIMQAAEEAVHEDPLDAASPEFQRALTVIGQVWTTREELIDAILALTPRQRDVVVLRFLASRPTRSVAQSMGISEATVRSLTHQAMKALQRRVWAWEKQDS